MKTETNDLLRFDLFQQLVLWLGQSMHGSRKGRQYLESNLSLMEIASDRELERLIDAHAEDKPAMKQQMEQHLVLLQDARQRGGTPIAVQDAYVNTYGGFALDLPPWLNIVEEQFLLLAKLRRPERTRKAQLTLLRDALAHARYDRRVADATIAELHNKLGSTLLEGPHYLSRVMHMQAFAEAITSHTTALTLFTLERYPLHYAKTQILLRPPYRLYVIFGQRHSIEQAITCYNMASHVYTLDTFPEEWARLQTALGAAYAQRKSGEATANLKRAIAHHKLALARVDETTNAMLAATLQINLGDTYQLYSMVAQSDDACNSYLELARACYRSALRVFAPQVAPKEWANIHIRLAALFQNYHGEDERQRDLHLRCAIVCYESALLIYTPDAFLVEYATTLVNLGRAHHRRCGSDHQRNLEQAAECYRTALTVFTSKAFPEEYHQVLHSLQDVEAELLEHRA
ncbi:MAG: hypothetical protein E6J34_08200 [Chloroflexi bacterium]|nr:MAG: hypothetical protein E6J34_08200 [Chloroflexota bacterium]